MEASTEIGCDSVCKVEIENKCGDGALDMTKLDSGGDSVGSGEIVTYDRAIEFFQKGGKIVECDGLGAGNAEVEGVNKEEKIIKVNIVDFLAKLQINGVSQKPVNVRMEAGEVGENAKLEEQVKDNKFVELDAKLQKDNAELTDDEKESRTVLLDDLRNVSNPEDSEPQLAYEAIQQVTGATDDTVAKGDSESLTEKSESAESDENLQIVEEIVKIVDDNTECQNVVMDYGVLSAKDDEAESASEVEQQLETEGTDDLMLKDVPESLIEESESVEVIDDDKESQPVVADNVVNVSGPEDEEAESANEVEQQLEAEATNDPKVEDDSGSLSENNEFVGLDEKLQNLEDTVEITDDNKETQTVLMDDVQNLSSSEDDEVKSVSELEQKLETEANNDLLVNDDSESQIINSESVEFDSKLQEVKEIAEIIDDNKRSQDVVGENVQNALSKEDDEAQSVNEAEHSSETGSTDDEIVNESTVSQVSEISIDENQTEVQLNESVEIMEDCPATESVKSEHENEEVCLEKDRVSQVEEAQFVVKKSQDRPALIFPPSFACPEIKVQFGSYVAPIRDLPKLILPTTCVMPEVYIEFGSFSSHKKAPNKLPDVSVTETETEPECGSENSISEIVTNDLQEENGEMPTCLEVDEIDDVQRAEEVPEGSESNNSEIILNDLKEENAEMQACHKFDEMDDIQKAEEVPEDSVSEVVDAQTVKDEVLLENLLIEEHASEDEKFTEEINNAQLQLDEKTRCRDAISSEIQMQKEITRAQNEACNAANLEVKAAKGLVKSKGQEIDYFQRLIKKTNPVADIDSRICKLVHMKNHETSCLEDENQVIREIKQLKSIRKQLALNVGFQDETQQALYQKDQIQEHVKVHVSSLNFYFYIYFILHIFNYFIGNGR
ncbi:hypothetical protein CTI12_AA212160 [Artemisia annua]|uniref:Uncharacterized protein n=1 Tax=Artemisia annua TaxID=35608 RepID=A0A2U1NWN1_ARTAN|nr:hypothetical protein CTI12_AA212160 [Artemisia annua]